MYSRERFSLISWRTSTFFPCPVGAITSTNFLVTRSFREGHHAYIIMLLNCRQAEQSATLHFGELEACNCFLSPVSVHVRVFESDVADFQSAFVLSKSTFWFEEVFD